MQKPRNAWAHYILAVHKGKEGHWVLIKGVKLCDTYSEGKWQFVCDGPHKGARIMEMFEVKKALEGVRCRISAIAETLNASTAADPPDPYVPQLFNFGSSQSRRLSPNRLKANTASVMARPGNRIIHGAVW